MPAITDTPPPVDEVDASESRLGDGSSEKQPEPFLKIIGTARDVSAGPASEETKLLAIDPPTANEASTLPKQDPLSAAKKNGNKTTKHCGKVKQQKQEICQNGSAESTIENKQTEECDKIKENAGANSAEGEDTIPVVKVENGTVSDAPVNVSETKKENEAKKRKSPKKNKGASSRKRNTKKTVKSHLLTEFYPVRRSSRRPKSVLEKEEEDSIFTAIETKCEDDLGVVEFDGKGRGVVAKRAFKKGCFIVEYAGDLINWTEAKKREEEYSKDPTVGCYMYYFIFDNVNYCVDATAESGRLGRLLNHSRKNPNCKTKLVRMPNPKGHDTTPRLIIIANRDINAGEELTYDYGDRDRETLQSHPWLKCT